MRHGEGISSSQVVDVVREFFGQLGREPTAPCDFVVELPGLCDQLSDGLPHGVHGEDVAVARDRLEVRAPPDVWRSDLGKDERGGERLVFIRHVVHLVLRQCNEQSMCRDGGPVGRGDVLEIDLPKR